MIFDELLLTKFEEAKSLKNILVGRSLWCMLSVVDLIRLHEDNGKGYVKKVIQFAAESLCYVDKLSVQLIALKTLIKYTRKLKNDDL